MKNRPLIAPIAMAVLTYGLWGLLPIYWKLFAEVPALEVMAHRIFWSFFFLCLLITAGRRWSSFIAETRALLKNRKKVVCLILGAFFVSLNWLTYIWAVNHDSEVESGLGYYIHPLLNVLVGVLLFKERLSLWQFLAVLLAAAGVAYLTVNYGSLPLVALALASTVTIYGVCKKITGLSALAGITLETAVLFPVASLYFLFIYSGGSGYPIAPTPTFFFLIGAGAVTAIPLITFAYSLNRLPLSFIGLISYLSPSITLMLGVLAYKEAFTAVHLVAFTCIWSGLVIFSLSKTAPLTRLERKISRFLNRLFS